MPATLQQLAKVLWHVRLDRRSHIPRAHCALERAEVGELGKRLRLFRDSTCEGTTRSVMDPINIMRMEGGGLSASDSGQRGQRCGSVWCVCVCVCVRVCLCVWCVWCVWVVCVWCGEVLWCGVVWCGVVWCGVV